MKKVKVLIIALVLIMAGAFFSYVNAVEMPNTLELKFSPR